jgi:SAM-dependent methyltransferase
MIGVLHHTESHQKIFDEIGRVLQSGGKFPILDLTNNNPFIELARALFPYMPRRIRQMFPDDLVIDETIPEKLRVEVGATLASLRKAGFSVE